MIYWTAKNMARYIGATVIVTKDGKWAGEHKVLDARSVRDSLQVELETGAWVSSFTERASAVRAIARRFSNELRLTLGEEKFTELRALNSTHPASALTCFSGDFCDSNMVMASALEFVCRIKEVDVQNDQQTALWNESWTLARAANFEPFDEHVYETIQHRQR